MLFFSFILSIFATVLSGGHRYFKLIFFLCSKLTDLIMPQINADGVKRNFYPGDKLPLWHEELEPQSSLLDILAAGNPDPMVQWICSPASHSPLWNFLLYELFKILSEEFETIPAGTPKCLLFYYYYHALVNCYSADCDGCSELWLVIRLELND